MTQYSTRRFHGHSTQCGATRRNCYLVRGYFDKFVNHGHEIGVVRVANGDVAAIQIHFPNEIFGTGNLNLRQGILHHRPLGNAPRGFEDQLRIRAWGQG